MWLLNGNADNSINNKYKPLQYQFDYVARDDFLKNCVFFLPFLILSLFLSFSVMRRYLFWVAMQTEWNAIGAKEKNTFIRVYDCDIIVSTILSYSIAVTQIHFHNPTFAEWVYLTNSSDFVCECQIRNLVELFFPSTPFDRHCNSRKIFNLFVTHWMVRWWCCLFD